MLCFIYSFPPFFILFQDMVLVECLLFFLPRNSALIISYSVNIPKSWICRQRAAAERNTEELWSWFPMSTASPDCSQASPVLSTLLLLGPWPHTLSLSTRPFTVYTITFSWGARRIKSLVSLHSNNLHIHKMVMGGGRWGERTDLREAGSAPPPPPPSAQTQACFCGKNFCPPAPHRAPPSCLSLWKMAPQSGPRLHSPRALHKPVNSQPIHFRWQMLPFIIPSCPLKGMGAGDPSCT